LNLPKRIKFKSFWHKDCSNSEQNYTIAVKKGKVVIFKNQIINKTNIPLWQRVLDLCSVEHNVVSANIANVTTPDYNEKKIDFEGELKNSLEKSKVKLATTNTSHISSTSSKGKSPKVYESNSEVKSSGVNNVDIDKQMAELAQNQLVYNIGAKLVAQNFQNIKLAIKGRL
jgi:flagellar basal-body rod protein FlgB